MSRTRPFTRQRDLSEYAQSLRLNRPRAGAMFDALVSRPGKVFTYRDLGLSKFGAQNSASQLRSALRDTGSPWRIATIVGEGFAAVQLAETFGGSR